MPLHSLLDWANQHSRFTAILLIVFILAAALYIFFPTDSPPTPPDSAWYFDPVTGNYFIAPSHQLSPLTSPAGNPAFRAHFYDCGECSDDTEPATPPAGFIAFYESYTPEAAALIPDVKRRIDAARGSSDPDLIIDAQTAQSQLLSITMKGKQVSRDAVNWESPDPSRGLPDFFEDEVRQRCRDKGDLIPCNP